MLDEAVISRRVMMKNVGAVAAAGALGALEEPVPSPAAPLQPSKGERPRTIALVGDRWHNSDYIRVCLNRLFNELGLPIDFTTNYYDLSRGLLEPYQLFIAFRDNMIWPAGYENSPGEGQLENRGKFPSEEWVAWITEEQGEAVKDFVAAGNGFYSMHNNAFVSRSSKNYREVQGGVALDHPPLRPFKVHIVNKNHPITQDVDDFMVTDEQHFTIYDKDPANIILRGENIDGLDFVTDVFDPNVIEKDSASESHPGRGAEQPVNRGTVSISGWAHEHGKGRVAFTAIGHTVHAMWQPEYLKIQKNAVRWLLKLS
jgi:type 1 glutamine amidotransferase